jgi:Permuted papain-like amidase enzyme, YaeF/YiiX, C92 family
MKKFEVGSLLFVRGDSFISKLIKKIDGGNFSHVCVVISEKGSILEAQRFTNSRIVPIYFDDYEVINLNLTDEQKDKLVKLAVDLVGIRYDYKQVFCELIEKILKKEIFPNNPKNMMCSELVTYLLLQIGYLKSTNEIDKFLELTPNELYSYLKHNKM